MDLNAFWAAESSDQGARLERLPAAMAAMPLAGVVDCAVRSTGQRRWVDTWAHRHAAEVIRGGPFSDDGFFYLQPWLAGLGRAVFEPVDSVVPVVPSLDALADLPHVRLPASRGGVHAWADEDWPDWEGLDHVAGEAFDGDLVSPDPVGQHWHFADPSEISTGISAGIPAHVPGLSALSGKAA